jgi:hypothetical protein
MNQIKILLYVLTTICLLSSCKKDKLCPDQDLQGFITLYEKEKSIFQNKKLAYNRGDYGAPDYTNARMSFNVEIDKGVQALITQYETNLYNNGEGCDIEFTKKSTKAIEKTPIKGLDHQIKAVWNRTPHKDIVLEVSYFIKEAGKTDADLHIDQAW